MQHLIRITFIFYSKTINVCAKIMDMRRFVYGTVRLCWKSLYHSSRSLLGVHLQPVHCVHMNYMSGGIEVTRAFVARLVYHQVMSA